MTLYIVSLTLVRQGDYYEWAESANFLSMLPTDTKARRKQAEAQQQSRLDPHLVKKAPAARVVKYSDHVFRQAAIEWLIATDQVVIRFSSVATVLQSY